MERFTALRWLDWTFVFLVLCAVFVWQLLTPEQKALKPVRAKSGRRPQRQNES